MSRIKFKKLSLLLAIAVTIVCVLLLLPPLLRHRDKQHPGQTGETQKAVASEQSGGRTSARKFLYWTCGMHPSVRADESGKCPICNMDLVPVYEEEMIEGESAEEVITQLKLGSRARALARVRTTEVKYLPLVKEIYTVGNMDYDERKVAYVAAWIAGRIDGLYVDFTGTEIKKGAPLIKIYSPDLISTQKEYLLALETKDKVKHSHLADAIRGADSLVEATRHRLLLWGITEEQIAELKKTREVKTHMIINAPISGTVIHKNAYEGKYVKEGENIYQIADLSNLWMKADVYEYEMSWVEEGQKVDITTPTFPGEVFTGSVSFIDPFLQSKTRSVKIRADVPNPESKLSPGMYVNATISIPIQQMLVREKAEKEMDKYVCPMHPTVVSNQPDFCLECGMALEEKKEQATANTILAIPKDAVLNTGVRNIVYLDRGDGVYEGKEVKVGPEAMALVNGRKERFFPVIEGLQEGDLVVSRANFLIDSQSQVSGPAAAAYGGALGEAEPVHRH